MNIQKTPQGDGFLVEVDQQLLQELTITPATATAVIEEGKLTIRVAAPTAEAPTALSTDNVETVVERVMERCTETLKQLFEKHASSQQNFRPNNGFRRRPPFEEGAEGNREQRPWRRPFTPNGNGPREFNGNSEQRPWKKPYGERSERPEGGRPWRRDFNASGEFEERRPWQERSQQDDSRKPSRWASNNAYRQRDSLPTFDIEDSEE